MFRDYLSRHNTLYQFLRLGRLFLYSNVFRINGGKKLKPSVLQLPLTYKCNSRCRMCNIWRQDCSGEVSLSEFSRMMRDELFSEVVGVGLNGGEPALINDLPKFVREVLKLPKLKSFNIITNGFVRTRFLYAVSEIYKMCKDEGVWFHLAVSLDGVNEVHDSVRNVPDAFVRATATISEILSNKASYCDSFDVACTIVKQNVCSLPELDAYCKLHNFPITYRLGIENARIGSDKIKSQYSVLDDPKLRQLAKEFFHAKMFESRDIHQKFKYFSIFYWMNASPPRRLLGCAWQEEGVTMDARGDLYYCAVASPKLGSLREESGSKIFFSSANMGHRKKILRDVCDSCIHDYSGKITISSLIEFIREIVRNRYSMTLYRMFCSLRIT